MSGNTVVVSVLADTKQFKNELGGLGGAFGALKTGMGVAAGALAAIGLASFASDAAAASDATDKFKQTLGFAGIGTDKIEALSKATKDYADKTVYSLADIQNVTAQLGANGVKDYDSLAMAAGNLNAVAGGNAETFKSVGMVLTQTAGAGKLTTENWNQLANAIPGASGMLQQAMLKNGAYTGNFRDAMAKGQITADEFNTALKQLGMDDAAQKAATSTKTFEGAIGNLQATITGGFAEILDAVKPFATEFAGAVSDVVGPALKSVAAFVKDEVVPSLKGFGEWLDKNKELLGGIAVVVGVLAAPLAGLKLGIMLIQGALAVWSTVTKIATAVQAAFNVVLNLNPIGLIVLAIAALVAGLIYFFTQTEVGKQAWATFTAFLTDSWKGFTEFIGKAWETIQQAFSDGVAAVGKFMDDARNAIVNAWNAVMAFFNEIPGKVQGVFAAAGQWLVDSGTKIMDGLKSGVNSAWTAVASFFTSIPGKITGALGNLGSLLFNAGKAVLQGFLDGMKNIWNNITTFVGDIAGWIQAHKGPLSEDKELLKPAGQVIMGGFLSSLKDGYRGVQGFVSGIGPTLAGALTSGDLNGAALAVPAGGVLNVYQFDGLTFTAADAEEASVLEAFVAMARRKARAA